MSDTRSLQVLAGQIEVPNTRTAAQRDEHIANTCARISSELTRSAPVDVVVLPELASIEYSRAAFSQCSN